MLEGTVKWFNPTKGFGFISIKNRRNDVFVHINAVIDSGYERLYEKDIVEFELIEDTQGRAQATNITAYELI